MIRHWIKDKALRTFLLAYNLAAAVALNVLVWRNNLWREKLWTKIP